MDRLPVELWLNILPLACTDGGYTGGSLSLVSRYVRDMARHLRYQSVSLIGHKHVQAFAGLVASKSPMNIRHLFLSVEVPSSNDVPLSGPNYAKLMQNLTISFLTILRAAAPTLLTLFVHTTPIIIVNTFGIHFPLLEDLSLNTLTSTGSSSSRKRDDFPSLRRLQLRGHVTHSVWEEVLRMSPAVTHVRLDGFHPNPHLPLLLRVLLGDPQTAVAIPARNTEEALNAASIASHLPFLKTVFVRPLIIQNLGMNHYQFRAYQWMRYGLESLASLCASGMGQGMLYMIPGVPSLDVQIKEPFTDWLDVVGGGDGPWSPTWAAD